MTSPARIPPALAVRARRADTAPGTDGGETARVAAVILDVLPRDDPADIAARQALLRRIARAGEGG